MKKIKWTKPKPFVFLAALHLTFLLTCIFFIAKHKGDPVPTKEKILVVPIDGVISMQSGSLRKGQTVQSIVRTLNNAIKDDDVKAVVLHINSPGGSVGAVQEIYGRLLKLKEKGKKIVSSFGDVSASGGYYLACASDHVVSHAGGITGSIGVVMQIPALNGLLKKVGVSMNVIKSGALKDAGSPFRTMTDRERRYFKSVILDAYAQFYNAVKVGRSLDDKDLKRVADGRVFTGQMALKEKLVDQLGGLDDAIDKAKELTGLQDKEPSVIYKREKPSIERLLQLVSKKMSDPIESLQQNHVQLMYLLQ